MARFTMLRSRPTAALAIPRGFEAVAEALLAGRDPREACSVAGRELAIDGVSVAEALAGLRGTWLRACRTDPSYAAASALVVAWTDSALAYLRHLSCEDPMTGLASLGHVRGRLAELYLQAEEVRDSWAVVVIELPALPAPLADDGTTAERLVHSMRLVRAAQAVRTVFVHGETVGRAGARRILAIVERDDRLGDRVRLVHRLLDDYGPDVPAPRVWIEGLPGTDRMAELLLDELAR